MSVVKMKLLDVLAHTPDNIQVAISVRDRMMVESGVERGRLALQLIHYAGWDVPTWPYQKLLARDDVPAELKPAIESILAREVWENEEKPNGRPSHSHLTTASPAVTTAFPPDDRIPT
jgi:hypothetical protein